MVFSSIIFVFLFLPMVLTIFFLLEKKYRYIFLLLSNLVFYFWGEKEYVIILLFVILLSYFGGLIISKYKNLKEIKKARLAITAFIIIDLFILIYYKYSYFMIGSALSVFEMFDIKITYSIAEKHLPIGVSFFIFQAISYLIDVYRSDVPPSKSLINYTLYISFFPQLIAGPIVRYADIYRQFRSKPTSSWDNMIYGIQRFIIGLAKKIIIANTAASFADKIFSLPVDQISSGAAWLGAICYSIQIFFDFSGYSDMAIGMARMFGFKFLENFNYPYVAKSIQDFWRRWHISLSSWFRDYLYIPLGGNRKGKYRTYLNLLVIFLLCGLWHGAAWTFIIWGAWHGLFLILERQRFFQSLLSFSKVFSHAYTLLIVVIGWVVFRANDPVSALDFLHRMFWLTSNFRYSISNFLNNEIIIVLIVALIASIPWHDLLFIKALLKKQLNMSHSSKFLYNLTLVSFLVIVFLTSAAYMANGTYNPFIYFRF